MLTVEKEMAVKVLEGDMTSARALADWLTENVYSKGAVVIPPVRQLSMSKDKVRVLVRFPQSAPDTTILIDLESIYDNVKNWLNNPGTTLVLSEGAILEMFELPEG